MKVQDWLKANLRLAQDSTLKITIPEKEYEQLLAVYFSGKRLVETLKDPVILEAVKKTSPWGNAMIDIKLFAENIKNVKPELGFNLPPAPKELIVPPQQQEGE